MKIPKNIIDKYKLIDIGEHNGESIIHDLKVFQSALPELRHLRFYESDFQGKPCNYIAIRNPQNRKIIEVTPEFLGDVPFQLMINEAL